MTKPSFLIIGQGLIGKPVAERLAKSHLVTGVATSAKSYQAPVRFLQKQATLLTKDDLAQADRLAVIISPKNHQKSANTLDLSAYQASYLAVCQHLADLACRYPDWLKRLQRLVFVSSTSVYGENLGQWIDENTIARPTNEKSQLLLTSENLLRQAFGGKLVVVRPSGIYGLQRTRMIRQTKARSGIVDACFTNRIMDTDLVTVLCQVLLSDQPKPLYLATDFLPATSAQVISFIAKTIGLPAPTITNYQPSGKRIISNLPKAWLQFMDYQQGYSFILNHKK